MDAVALPSTRPSSRLFVGLGVLWLLLAAAHLIYQLTNPTVEVRWETATEVDTAGFNLYRSLQPDGPFLLLNEASGLIPGQGEAVSGAAYRYVDGEVEVGQTYYYLLEEVENDLTVTRYEDDLFSYRVPYLTWWTAALTCVSILVGVALLVVGLREDRNL